MTKNAKPETTPETPETSKPKRLRWTIGLFRNDQGKLSTVYTSVAGEVVPYLRERVGDHPILFHGTYTDMKYSEARKALLADAEKAGIKSEDASSTTTTTTPEPKPTPKKKSASTAKSKAAAKTAKEA